MTDRPTDREPARLLEDAARRLRERDEPPPRVRRPRPAIDPHERAAAVLRRRGIGGAS